MLKKVKAYTEVVSKLMQCLRISHKESISKRSDILNKKNVQDLGILMDVFKPR